MFTTHDMDLGHAKIGGLAGLINHLLMVKDIGIAHRFTRSAECAELALDATDVRMVDVAVVVEVNLTAMVSLAHDVGKPAERVQVGTLDCSESIVETESLACHDFRCDLGQRRIHRVCQAASVNGGVGDCHRVPFLECIASGAARACSLRILARSSRARARAKCIFTQTSVCADTQSVQYSVNALNSCMCNSSDHIHLKGVVQGFEQADGSAGS